MLKEVFKSKLMHMNFNYIPRYKPNQLICGNGNIAIVTGWTVKTQVAKHLDSEDFAVIGNLYSPTRGISPLIRNLLANPHVRYLVLLNATKEDNNAGGCNCLQDLFTNGFVQGKSDTGKDCWVINSFITGYIDIEIPESVLNELIYKQINPVNYVTNIKDCIEIVKQLNTVKSYPYRDKPLIFPVSEITPTVLPNNRYGHRIEGKTIAETWVKILHRIKTTGTIRPTGYDGQWQELIDLMAVITDEPEDFYFPEPNYLPIDRNYLTNYIPQILEDAPYQEGVKYTYGQRLRSWFGQDQIEKVINKLIGEIDAASAVMNLWDSGSGGIYADFDGVINKLESVAITRFGRGYGDSDHDYRGSPCLNHIWVRVVNNELSLTATFRSNDMFGAWVANAMGLRALQMYIRDEINKRSEFNLSLAPLITISQSAHIYDDCWENVDKLIDTQYAKIYKNQEYFDSCGNFLISIENQEIIVQQTTSGSGELIANYSGRNAKQVYQKIVCEVPYISPVHAFYIGSELQKAEIALSRNLSYTQDQSIIF